MSSSSSSEDNKTLTLKLLINKTTNKVVYAESSKPTVDFLFHTLLLPISTALKHINPTTGSLYNLYNSVEAFTPDLLQTPATKQSLLTPKTASAISVPLWSTPNDVNPPVSPGVVFYTCSDPTSKAHRTLTGGRSWQVTDVKGSAACTHCGGPMTEKVDLKYVEPTEAVQKVSGEGYVKPHANYMITDDLVVKALTTKDVLKLLLNNPDVGEMDSLKERVVTLDKNQGMELLKASLISKTVLTDTFLSQTLVERSECTTKSSKKLDELIVAISSLTLCFKHKIILVVTGFVRSNLCIKRSTGLLTRWFLLSVVFLLVSMFWMSVYWMRI